jgi:hypothetical protein
MAPKKTTKHKTSHHSKKTAKKAAPAPSSDAGK